MGRTACTEPQCLYMGELYLTFMVVTTKITVFWVKLQKVTQEDNILL